MYGSGHRPDPGVGGLSFLIVVDVPPSSTFPIIDPHLSKHVPGAVPATRIGRNKERFGVRSVAHATVDIAGDRRVRWRRESEEVGQR